MLTAVLMGFWLGVDFLSQCLKILKQLSNYLENRDCIELKK